VPRDDKQRIWKRVPLAELGVDVNRPVAISRKEQEASKDYARVVKKLKVGHVGASGEEDKENIDVDAQIESKEHKSKKSKPHDGNFVPMKMEEDDFWGSPKKKFRQPAQNTHLWESGHAGPGASLEHEQLEGAMDCTAANSNKLLEVEELCEEVDIAGDRVSDEHGSMETDVVTKTSTDQELQDVRNQYEAAAADSAHDISMHSMVNSKENESPIQSDFPTEEPQAETFNSIALADSLASKQDRDFQLGKDHALIINDLRAHACEDDQKAQRIETGVPETSSIHVNQEANTTDGASHEAREKAADALRVSVTEVEEGSTSVLEDETIEEPQSSSPPTILAENVIVDELASARSSNRQLNVACEEREEEYMNGHRLLSGVQALQKIASKRVSDDETAFLQSFLSRTKAERAARELESHQTAQDTLPVPHEGSTESTDIMPTFEVPTEMPASAPQLEPPVEDQDQQPGSPLRRSKRAAVTSLPRSQILPNAIQLKRSNGNEFIFSANQASSVANVAIVTRTNTKRNKGSALNVHARLEQLMARNVDDETNGAEEKAVKDGSGEGEKDKGLKKRKRDKNDDGKKSKKALRWNEDNLVSYQEPPKTNDDWQDFEDSSQDSIKDEHKEDLSNGGGTKIKLMMSSVSPGNATITAQDATDATEITKQEELEAEAVQQDEKEAPRMAQSTVRRMRRGIAGSVNGTPGPKTRSKKVLVEHNTVEATSTEVQAERGPALGESAAASAAMSTLATDKRSKGTTVVPAAAHAQRSRMPVLSARKGVAASAGTRTATATSNSLAQTTTEGNQQGKVKEDSKGDVLGKRRLRVRN